MFLIEKLFEEKERNRAKLSSLNIKIIKDQKSKKPILFFQPDIQKPIDNDKKNVVGLIDDIKSSIDNLFNSRIRSYSTKPTSLKRNQKEKEIFKNELESQSYNSLQTILREEKMG